MEHVFFLTHIRLVELSVYILPKKWQRSLFEYIVLFLSATSLISLIYLHKTYISSQESRTNCLSSIFNLDNTSISNNDVFLSNDSYAIVKIRILPYHHQDHNSEIKFIKYRGSENDILRNQQFNFKNNAVDALDTMTCTTASMTSSSVTDSETIGKRIYNSYSLMSYFSNMISSVSDGLYGHSRSYNHQSIFIYAMEKELIIPPKHGEYRRPHREVTVYDVMIPSSHSCLGPVLPRTLIQRLVGYDTNVINWAIASFGARGFVYNYFSQELFTLDIAFDFISLSINPAELKSSGSGRFITPWNHPWNPEMGSWMWLKETMKRSKLPMLLLYKVGVVLTTVSLFFTTSTIVSFMLRETQERMLRFTFMLQHHVSHRLPFASLVFTHLIETLVFVPIMIGIVFLMFQFFKDQVLTFMVWSLVWSAEVFSVLSLRTRASISFFPRIFLCYFSLFHIYFFSRPFGFSYLALLTTALFILHSMVHFFYRHEIPAIVDDTIRADHPRATLHDYSQNDHTASTSAREVAPSRDTLSPHMDASYINHPLRQGVAAPGGSVGGAGANEDRPIPSDPCLPEPLPLDPSTTSIFHREPSLMNSPGTGTGTLNTQARLVPLPTADDLLIDVEDEGGTVTGIPSPPLGPAQGMSSHDDPSLVSVTLFRGLYSPSHRQNRSLSRSRKHASTTSPKIIPPLDDSHTLTQAPSSSSSSSTTSTSTSSRTSHPPTTSFYRQQETDSVPLLGLVGAASLADMSVVQAVGGINSSHSMEFYPGDPSDPSDPSLTDEGFSYGLSL